MPHSRWESYSIADKLAALLEEARTAPHEENYLFVPAMRLELDFYVRHPVLAEQLGYRIHEQPGRQTARTLAEYFDFHLVQSPHPQIERAVLQMIVEGEELHLPIYRYRPEVEELGAATEQELIAHVLKDAPYAAFSDDEIRRLLQDDQ